MSKRYKLSMEIFTDDDFEERLLLPGEPSIACHLDTRLIEELGRAVFEILNKTQKTKSMKCMTNIVMERADGA